ncbi:MAG: SDR family NAD(P)-dependent oxidoreductase [Burkholderiaceae bacterium]
MNVVILTGASRCLGAAMAARLIAPECQLICISRKPNEALAEIARAKGAALDWYLQDLADADATDDLARSICSTLPHDASRYALIHNAGLAEPVGRLVTLDVKALAAAAHVNLTAAMIFTARLLAATRTFDGERRILNISSGLARRPMDGTAAYCATKAGLDMFTRCINAEAQATQARVRAVSLAPGVIDTDMQVGMRGQDAARFPESKTFRAMKEEGRLSSPDTVAEKIVAFLERDDFGKTEIDDIRNY